MESRKNIAKADNTPDLDLAADMLVELRANALISSTEGRRHVKSLG
jgi:hypothetical protein